MMASRRRTWLLCCGALIGAQFAASARAEGLQPPSEFLHAQTNNIIAGTLEGIDPAGKLTFEKGD